LGRRPAAGVRVVRGRGLWAASAASSPRTLAPAGTPPRPWALRTGPTHGPDHRPPWPSTYPPVAQGLCATHGSAREHGPGASAGSGLALPHLVGPAARYADGRNSISKVADKSGFARVAGYSRSQIDRAGGVLRRWWTQDDDLVSTDAIFEAFTTMIEFREAFQVPLNKTAVGLLVRWFAASGQNSRWRALASR
jgi:hypothetical protein